MGRSQGRIRRRTIDDFVGSVEIGDFVAASAWQCTPNGGRSGVRDVLRGKTAEILRKFGELPLPDLDIPEISALAVNSTVTHTITPIDNQP